MHMICKMLILCLCAHFIIGCKHMRNTPHSLRLELSEEEGPEIYRQGYKDGCTSGYAGYSNRISKMFFEWTQDPILAQNPVYYQVWKDAYSYCANYAMMALQHGWGNWR